MKKRNLGICASIIAICILISVLKLIPCLPEKTELESGMYFSENISAIVDSSYLHRIEISTLDRTICIETPEGWIKTTFEMKKNLWGYYVIILDEENLNGSRLRFFLKENGTIMSANDFEEFKCKIKNNEIFTNRGANRYTG